MDGKERKEFDAVLASGVDEGTWDKKSARALDRLAAGEFDEEGDS